MLSRRALVYIIDVPSVSVTDVIFSPRVAFSLSFTAEVPVISDLSSTTLKFGMITSDVGDSRV